MRTLVAILALLLFALPAQAEVKDDFSLGLDRYIDYSEHGNTAKLVSRTDGMNGFVMHVLIFRDTTTATFKDCKPMLEQQLPPLQSLSIGGRGTVTKYKNDGVENLIVYDITHISRCGLYEGGDMAGSPEYNDALVYRAVRHGAENFPSIISHPPQPTTPQEDWLRFREQGAELRFINKLQWGSKMVLLNGEGEATLDNARYRRVTPASITLAFTDFQDPVLKNCRALMEKPVVPAMKLSIFGYGTVDPRKEPGSPATLRFRRMTECKLVPAVDFIKIAAISAPSTNLYVASIKTGGATFWLHYTGNSQVMLRNTRASGFDSPYLAPGELSCAAAWRRLADAKTKNPMRLGNLQLTAEGDVKAGAAKVKQYADGGSGDHIYMLAHLYFHGVGVEKNQKAAYDLLRSVGPGGMNAGGPDINPWVNQYAGKDAEAVAAVLTFDSKGKRGKVEFKMPGEPGAPVTNLYHPFAAKEPGPMDDEGPVEPPPFMMPPMEESLTLYPPPYPVE